MFFFAQLVSGSSEQRFSIYKNPAAEGGCVLSVLEIGLKSGEAISEPNLPR